MSVPAFDGAVLGSLVYCVAHLLATPPRTPLLSQSEYPPECDARRAFISGFDGSAGTVVVTCGGEGAAAQALLWTDGRYFLQAEQQLGPGWTLMRHGTPTCPEVHGRCRRCGCSPPLLLPCLAAELWLTATHQTPSSPASPSLHVLPSLAPLAGARVAGRHPASGRPRGHRRQRAHD